MKVLYCISYTFITWLGLVIKMKNCNENASVEACCVRISSSAPALRMCSDYSVRFAEAIFRSIVKNVI